MKPYYEEPGITIYHGDAREIIPALDARFDAVLTDPVWPNATADLAGKEAPERLLRQALKLLAHKTDRIVIQLGFDSDPRFLRAVPKQFQFVRACWLDCARPHYKGFLLAGADVAYIFGSIPKRQGWTVLPGMCRSNDSRGKEAAHPCPRKLQHVRWLARYYCQGPTIDPFMGSGTTALACKALGIPFVGVEIEERYCNLAASRLGQGVLDLDESTPHRSDDWMAALGAEDQIKEDVRRLLEERG